MVEQRPDGRANTDEEAAHRVVEESQAIGVQNVTDRERLQAAGMMPAAEQPLEVVQRSTATAAPLDVVQQASEESFPASDSPTYTSEAERERPLPSEVERAPTKGPEE